MYNALFTALQRGELKRVLMLERTPSASYQRLFISFYRGSAQKVESFMLQTFTALRFIFPLVLTRDANAMRRALQAS